MPSLVQPTADMDCSTYELYDLVVVGTGFHGLSVARTYLQVNPLASVALLDDAESIGGVWAKERLYPGLKTNNQFGSYEFSDFPMAEVGVKKGQHIPGIVVHRYLSDYATKFDLLRHVQFKSKVLEADQVGENGWLLTVETNQETFTGLRQVLASKLVVATGLTSEPLMPIIPGQESFQAPIFHSKDFKAQSATLKTAQSVAVCGGAKSGWDVAYAYASAGVQVDWIIRESGHGPNWMTPARVTPLKILAENLIFTRLVSFTSPCIWADFDGFAWMRNFLHGTWLGRKIADGWYGLMMHGASKDNDYDGHSSTAALKPWHNVFWIGATRGILNYDTNIFELVKSGMIKVHIADISRLSERTLHLSNSSSISADALICCTGWKLGPAMTFTKQKQPIHAELGLPHHSSEKSSMIYTQKLDAEILARFPKLKEQPTTHLKASKIDTSTSEPTFQGFSLYRCIIPPQYIHARNIAFAGMLRCPSTTLIAQAQALWITAYFNGSIPSLAHTGADAALEAKVAHETRLHSRFGKWRFPCSYGALYPDFFFDGLPMIDMLLHDLGVRNHRKAHVFAEMFTPYRPKDYVGIVDEFLARQGEPMLEELKA